MFHAHFASDGCSGACIAAADNLMTSEEVDINILLLCHSVFLFYQGGVMVPSSVKPLVNNFNI